MSCQKCILIKYIGTSLVRIAILCLMCHLLVILPEYGNARHILCVMYWIQCCCLLVHSLMMNPCEHLCAKRCQSPTAANLSDSEAPEPLPSIHFSTMKCKVVSPLPVTFQPIGLYCRNTCAVYNIWSISSGHDGRTNIYKPWNQTKME